MSNGQREIAARGVTARDIGKTVHFSTADGKYQIGKLLGVQYDTVWGTTELTVGRSVALSNLDIVIVED